MIPKFLAAVGLMVALSPFAKAESIARIWNEQNLDAIRIDFPAPTVHARNLFHTSIAMWDAWAVYEPSALGYLHREAVPVENTAAARDETISYAAFGVLSSRYLLSTNSQVTEAALRSQMVALGHDPDFTSTEGTTPAALGNRIARTVLDYYSNDGSNEQNLYVDNSYAPVNQPLILANPGTIMVAPNRWQPLAFDVAQTQNGQVADKVQRFVGANWAQVRPFAMSLAPGESIYYDPGEPPKYGSINNAQFLAANVEVIRRSGDLDPSHPATINISPGAIGNNTLGQNDGTGYPINPVTGSAYPENVVRLGDYGRVIAEYWADGPDSETPPGHWNTVMNTVTEHPDFEPRIGGAGEIVPQLEWDVKTYFALNGAMHDSAVAAWGCKRFYDFVRPISSIRYLAGQGVLPLEPGLIEVVTDASNDLGERHEDLTEGKIAIRAWGGEPDDPENDFTGTKWIHAEDWLPYQRATFVTPAFAGYVSGHSCFSRAAAEVLTLMTGSPYFPGGLGEFVAPADDFLAFERGPSSELVLQWATYYDAADEAGISRIYGGIHLSLDDGPGRVMGSQCGIAAYQLASKYFDASILAEPVTLRVERTTADQYNMVWNASRGLNYQLDLSTDLSFWAPAVLPVQAEELEILQAFDPASSGRDAVFFRVRQIE